MKTLLLTGSGGLVGYRLRTQLKTEYTVIAPDRSELNITDSGAVMRFVQKHTPDVIINAAAFADVSRAELQRDKKDGMCWKVNVEGTRNLVGAARVTGAFIILLSTGSVFAGTSRNSGPFTEVDSASPKHRLGWYAYTKLIAEKSGVDAIIRLSHVIGPKQYESPNRKSDYLRNIIQLSKKGALYPLFPDQLFPVTFLDDIKTAVEQVGEKRLSGIFHVVSTDHTSPYELARFVLKRDTIPTVTYKEFIQHISLPLRYSQYHAIDGKSSRSLLHLPHRSWREIVTLCYR